MSTSTKAEDTRTLKRSLAWSFLMNWGSQGISSVVSLVLAAMLGPTEFGIVSIAFVFLSFIQFFLDFGFGSALVQRPNLDDQHLDSAFWLTFGSSLVLAAISVSMSHWWATMNHDVRVATVLTVLTLRLPLGGLTIVQHAILLRHLEFKFLAIRENASALAGAVVGIAMGVLGFGVWALVGQALSRDIVALGLLWQVSSWRPRLRFSSKHLNDILGFSLTAFIANAGSLVHGQVEAALIGLFFGPAPVGLYRLADRIRQMLLLLTSQAVKTIAFPNLAKVQSDPVVLRRTYLGLTKMSAIVAFPALLTIAACSDRVVDVLGSKWHGSADVISILCVAGMILSIAQFTGPILLAKGRPGIAALLSWSLAAGCVVVISVVGMHLRGASAVSQVNGIAFSKLALLILYLPATVRVATRFAGVKLSELGLALLPALLPATASVVSAKAVFVLLPTSHLPAWISLGSACAAAGVAGAAVILWMEPRYRSEARQFLQQRLGRAHAQ